MSRADERNRAKELQVLDARDLLKAKFPALLPHLTAEIDKVQRLIDVEAINEAVDREYEEFGRKTSKGWVAASHKHLRDPADEEKLKAIAKKKIATTNSVRIRVDVNSLLAPDALKPTSDNPDEAAYLLQVRSALDYHGVWLSVFFNRSQIAHTTYTALNDPRRWFVTLNLGNGDEFKTDTGRLTRDVILGTPLLGGGYYEHVYQGPTWRLLQEMADRVSAKVTEGWRLHHAWAQNRAEAKPGVVWTSDRLGRATWPSESIWDQPQHAVVRFRTLFSKGQLMEATKFLILAATLAEWNSRAVHEYIKATMKGAERAVSILEVAVIAGKIAESLLLLYSVGTSLIRLLGGKASTTALSTTVRRQLPAGKPQQVAPYPPSPSAVAPRPAPTPATPAPRRMMEIGADGLPRHAPRTSPPVGNGAPGRTGTIGSTPYTPPPAKNLAGGQPNKWGSANNMEEVINKVRVKNGMKPLPAKTNPGRLGLHEDALVKKAHDDYMAWLRANPGATLDQKIAKFDILQEVRRNLGKQLD
jgi:hypothetical protein